MDIGLLGCGESAKCCEETLPNCLTVVEDGMDDDGSHSCKAKTV